MVIKKAIHKYGKENFTIEVIETCEETLLDEREKYWIAYYDSYRKGYNSTIGGKEHSKMSKLEKDAEDIVELYNTGFSLREIASQYNVDHATIKLILIKSNVKLRSTRTYKLTEGERQEIISKIEHGITRKEIMEEYHISKSYLSQLINGKRRI